MFRDALTAEPMRVPEMRVELRENAVPYCITTPRQVPLRYQESVSKMLDEIVSSKIIAKETRPAEWCSPAFFVPKPDGVKVILVTDYSKLNKYVKRPVHPFPSVHDIVQSIPAGSKFFAKLDATHGYFQLALENESSLLTTFLVPTGRYRYLRAPMGPSSSSDKWCRQSDRAIEGMPFAKKIIDNILVWADSLPELIDRVRQIATKCKELNIILSRKKFMIGNELPFAGLIVGAKGVSPDPERTRALSEFPRPKDVTGVRSFLGLANQLSGFVPDFAHMTVALRGLTGKNASFIWLEDHEREFEKVKKLLTSEMIVTHFDPKLPVVVLTDASRLFGLGYAMEHMVDGRFCLVTCGSKSLTPTQ